MRHLWWNQLQYLEQFKKPEFIAFVSDEYGIFKESLHLMIF
jgi:hypothetical protein